MAVAYVLDRYTNKNVLVTQIDEETFSRIKVGDKLVYETQDQTGGKSLTIGTYIGHEIQTDRKGTFRRILEGDEKIFFDEQQAIALQIFPTFKKRFKKHFATSIPVTARYHVFADQIYFFFYSEERYVFSEFVKGFRELLNKNIFLFQIGARDMIKMSPGTDCIVGCNGISLCCKSSRALPSVEIENLILQNLEGRDIEKLKGRCGKLKCCLVYELDLYINESKEYPPRGSTVCSKGSPEQCGFVTSFNIINHEVTVRTDDGMMFRLPLSLLKVKKLATGERTHAPHQQTHRQEHKTHEKSEEKTQIKKSETTSVAPSVAPVSSSVTTQVPNNVTPTSDKK